MVKNNKKWILYIITTLLIIETTLAYNCTRYTPLDTSCNGQYIGTSECNQNLTNLNSGGDGCESIWNKEAYDNTPIVLNVSKYATGYQANATQNYPLPSIGDTFFTRYICGAWWQIHTSIYPTGWIGTTGNAMNCFNGTTNSFNYTYKMIVTNQTRKAYNIIAQCWNSTGWAIMYNVSGNCTNQNDDYVGFTRIRVRNNVPPTNYTLNISVYDTNNASVTSTNITNTNNNYSTITTSVPFLFNYEKDYQGNTTWKILKSGWWNTIFMTTFENLSTNQTINNSYITQKYSDGTVLTNPMDCYEESTLTTKHNRNGNWYVLNIGNNEFYCNVTTTGYVGVQHYTLLKLSNEPLNTTITFQANIISLNFTRNGIISNTSIDIADKDKSTNITASNVTIPTSNLTNGRVIVLFNKNTTGLPGNYSQAYEFIKTDDETYIQKTFELLTTADWYTYLRVFDYSRAPLADTNIETRCEYRPASFPNWTTHSLTNIKLTDQDGYAYFYADKGSQCYVTITKTGYDPINILITVGSESYTREDPVIIYLKETNGETTTRPAILYMQKTWNENTTNIIGTIIATDYTNISYTTNYWTSLGNPPIRLTTANCDDNQK